MTLVARILAYKRLLLIGGLVLALDQASKAWIAARLPFDVFGGSAISVIPGFLYLVHRGNTGAAWSLFLGRSALLAILAAATLAAIAIWRRSLGIRSLQISFGLLCGGIAGNLLDRLRHGYVTDFIDCHFGRYVYPTFNVADACICIGIGLYIRQSLRRPGARS